MLTQYDPVREFDRLASSLWEHARTPGAMQMDAVRRGDELVVQLDLPGVDADAIELTVERNVLSVTARRAVDRDESDELIVNERPQGTFHRQVFLDEGLDAEHLDADHTNGVLTIRVPVLESARPRRVPIRMHEGGQRTIEASATTEPAS